MSQFPRATDLSSRYPVFKAAAKQAETEQLDHMDAWLPLFFDGLQEPRRFHLWLNERREGRLGDSVG